MKNKSVIIGSAVIVVLLVAAIIIFVASYSAKWSTSNNSGNISNENLDSDEFEFIYDINSISESWWNLPNEDWTSFGYTNKNVFDNRWETNLGNTTGKLKVRVVDFTTLVHIEGKNYSNMYYKMEVKNNKFLIPEKLSRISNKYLGTDTEYTFYIVGNNLFFYPITMRLENSRIDGNIEQGKWNTVRRKWQV